MAIDHDICQNMLAVRHDLHANPETAFEEVRTSEAVARELRAAGLSIDRGLAGTGIVGTLKNGDGPSIALRADMDALPMQELGSPPYKSRVVGKMHGCGHDGHTAMLLGAAQQLARGKGFSGTVHFIFQPAEEHGAGGRRMIEDGLFEKFDIGAVYGMHNPPHVPRGTFVIKSGIMTTNLDTFEIVVTGRGCHGAMPEKGIDPVVVACQVVGALQTLSSRRVAPSEPVVLSVTQIHGGDTWNVIPDSVVLRGTVRTLTAATQDFVESLIQQVSAGICAANGATVACRYMRGYPGVVNSERETSFSVRAAAALVGKDRVRTDIKPSMASEDFAFMLQERPGAYIGIGAGEHQSDFPLHSSFYDFNDAILPLGAAYWVSLVEQQLPRSAEPVKKSSISDPKTEAAQ